MTLKEIKTELITLISNIFEGSDLDNDSIEYADLINDMRMDSINFISMIVAIELKFDITISDHMLLMENFRNLNTILEIVVNEINKGMNP